MRALPEDPWERWFRRPRPVAQPRLRLVCFPHAGGSATYFRGWGQSLPPAAELLAVQYPGREDRLREPCVEDMPRLADQVTAALGRALARPVVLFGHSLGAAVAYEVARRIERRRPDALAALFVSGRPAPRYDKGGDLHLDDDLLWSDVRRLRGTDEPLLDHPELRAVVLPALRGDYCLSETWVPEPGPPLRCPVVACVGAEDPEVTPAEAEAWGESTAGEFRLRVFPGGHFYLADRREELVADMLRTAGLDVPRPAPWPSAP
jgi:pyochelin biosynthetic protein PchC